HNREIIRPIHYITGKYLDRYILSQGTISNLGNVVKQSNVGNPDTCAQKCYKSGNNTCRSFDFCESTKSCYLSRDRKTTTSVSSSTADSSCLHYSRKYLFDFTISPDKHLPYGPVVSFSNTSVDDCAKLCVDDYGLTCRSFMFCGHSTCNIFSVNNRNVQSQISSNAVCDTYTRHLSYVGPSSSVATAQIKNGYSSGSMAAVAFGALIPGMVLGAAILYFSKTRKLIQNEHEMKIIHNEQSPDED
ncbi:uncharacterized protein LOC132757564, partial [Ruditapes philippinarum]|uniref:uncharacterized protein LOC132757564 n=1 Tax=Ruditapes philippinarum TaxID=129788 RepID=UPI00295AAE2E